MAATADSYADVAVLTIVPEAHIAALEILKLESVVNRLGQPFGTGRVSGVGGGELIVVCDRAADRSNQPALDAASRILRAWCPRLLILADIGGGVFGDKEKSRDGIRLGDVVYASNLEYFELIKEVEGGKEEARKFAFFPPSRGPRVALNLLKHAHKDWHSQIRPSRPLADDSTPVLLEGEIVVGEKLMTNPASPTVEKIVTTYPKAIAVDMESVGAASAVYGLQQEGLYAEFLVLRGISDFFDRPGNEETRDAWKPYAAEAAVAAALLVINNTPTRADAAAETPAPVSRYVMDFRKRLTAAWQPETTTFRLHLLTAARGTVPSSTNGSVTEIERHEVLETLLQERRVVMYGPSGAGKSETLALLARQVAPETDPVVVLVDLKRFQPHWAEQLSDQPVGEALVRSMDAVLSASIELLSIEQLEEVASSRKVLVLVDGINEVPVDSARRMLSALHEYARHQQSAHVLVTDRQPGLFYRETEWKFIALAGLRESDARDVVDSTFGSGTYDGLDEEERRLLGLPFFLDRALRSANPRLESRAQAVYAFLRDVGCTDEQLNRAGSTAFHTYQERRNYLDENEMESLRAEGLLEMLEAAAVVVARGEQKSFSHQLVHQFLAGWHLAKDRAMWGPDELDAVTADAASLDAVGMTLALIPDRAARDDFLRAVYDWNWRATLLALREMEGTDRRISDGLEVALLALSAEKRFDPVVGTRERAEGQLGRLRSNHVQQMLAQPTLDDLLDYVEKIEVAPSESWYREWKSLFAGMRGRGDVGEADAMKIAIDDPVRGWTVANALRRYPESAVRSAQLRAIYFARQQRNARDRAVRWRVAHALGTWPTRDNGQFLLNVVDSDEYRWCRYGAVRSAVEMAARTTDDSLRRLLLEGLQARIESIDAEPLSELAWAAQFTKAAPGWVDAVRPLLEAVRDSRPPESIERQRWDRRMDSFIQYAEGTSS